MRLDWKRFGRDVQKQQGFKSIRDVAKEVGISHATYFRAATGKVVSAETVIIISYYILDKDPRSYLK